MAMIHINRNRENIGKFNDQDVANGLKSGRFLPTDLAWREPMASWEPLSAFTDLPPPGEVGENLGQAATEPTPALTGGRIVLGECFSRGWENFQKNMGVLVLGTFAFLVVNVSLCVVSELAQSVMEMFMKNGQGEEQILKFFAISLGVFFSILTSIVTAILSAGFLWMFIKNSRGKAQFADLFSGFRSGVWLQILMAGVAWGAIMVCVALLTLVPGILATDKFESPVPAVLGALIFMVPLTYLSVGLGFVFPLIIDRRIDWREAMRTAISTVHRQWFAVAGLVLIYTLMALAGILACCMGILVTMPLGYAVWAEGYRCLFGDPAEPPQE